MAKIKSQALLAAIVATTVFSGSAHASKIFLKNEDNAEVHVVVEAGEGHKSTVYSKKPIIDTSLKPNEEKEILLSKQQLGNIEIFSVTGTVKMPSLYNRCFPLTINTDYKIIFVGGRAGGTVCVVQPLTVHQINQ